MEGCEEWLIGRPQREWLDRRTLGRLPGWAGALEYQLFLTGDSVEAPDKYTVKVYLKRPAPAFQQLIASDYAGIIEPGLDAVALKKAPSGTGAYILDRQFAGSLMVFKPNPNYWKPGLPYLDELQQIVLSNPALGPALIAGQIDYSYFTGFPPDTLTGIEQLVSQGKMFFSVQPHNRMAGITVNNGSGPTSNVRVRKALDLALDRKAFNEATLYGKGLPGLVFRGEGLSTWLEGLEYGGVTLKTPDDIWKLPGWNPATKEQDRQKARDLLAEAGYGTTNPLKLTLSVQTLPDPKA
ncbi:MAG: ABC transporter substrate-binding protein [Chloroflexota bacterium]|nr:ABC transporter substrate-binding protein [Chloroflexota bacterium]